MLFFSCLHPAIIEFQNKKNAKHINHNFSFRRSPCLASYLKQICLFAFFRDEMKSLIGNLCFRARFLHYVFTECILTCIFWNYFFKCNFPMVRLSLDPKQVPHLCDQGFRLTRLETLSVFVTIFIHKGTGQNVCLSSSRFYTFEFKSIFG